MILGSFTRVIQGDTRSLDYSSNAGYAEHSVRMFSELVYTQRNPKPYSLNAKKLRTSNLEAKPSILNCRNACSQVARRLFLSARTSRSRFLRNPGTTVHGGAFAGPEQSTVIQTFLFDEFPN